MMLALAISTYMLLDPAHWLYKLMELTFMSSGFKLFILVLALVGFAISYGSEIWVFPSLARWIGHTKERLFPKMRKKRKEYKIIAEGMRV
jgi:cation-transporting P-type ATPase 13A2